MKPSAFERTYRDQASSLKRAAYLIVGSEAAAEDIVHDVFIRCRERLEDLDHPESYLRSSVVNDCRRWIRRESRGAFLIRTSGRTRAINEDVGDQYEMVEFLDVLSPKMRTAIVLRYYLGMSHAEIARTMNCRPGTSRSLVKRGLDLLRKEMEHG